MTRLGPLAASHVEKTGSREGLEVVLVHGFGLGGWIWERDQALLAQSGHSSWAVDLPGHGTEAGGSADFEALVSALQEAVSSLESPVLVGMGGGALVAQVVAQRSDLHSLVLINPLPPGGVKFRPGMAGLQALLSALPSFLTGRPQLSLEGASSTTLTALPEPVRAAVHARTTPWPEGLAKSLFRRPSVAPSSVPTLVLTGLQDHLVPANVGRLVGDFHNAVTWRFDDVGHLPALEPGGERVVRSMLEWLANPQPRRVLEVQAFQPSEGVGQQSRDARSPEKTARSNSRFLTRNRGKIKDREFKAEDDASAS